MRSFAHKADNRRQVYLALSGSIEGQLRDAYAKRQELGLETQASLAKKLGVNRSAVNRRLTGRQKNMTVETVADMVWALGQCIRVEVFDPKTAVTNQHMIVPVHKASSTSKHEQARFESTPPTSKVKPSVNTLLLESTV